MLYNLLILQDDIFRLNTPLAEIFIRGSVMYLAIFFLMRVIGKRESGAHSLTDLLVIVLVAEAAAHGMAGDASGITDSVLLIVTILFWSVALDAVAYRFPALRRLIKSKPSPLILDGVMNKRALRREFMHPEEVMEQLRLHGITNTADVARAYLEPNGMVSVIRADRGEVEDPPKTPAVT
ncbi:MAG TPA: YetF domain-containing protein [Gemmatimonadaceae bacterium]